MATVAFSPVKSAWDQVMDVGIDMLGPKTDAQKSTLRNKYNTLVQCGIQDNTQLYVPLQADKRLYKGGVIAACADPTMSWTFLDLDDFNGTWDLNAYLNALPPGTVTPAERAKILTKLELAVIKWLKDDLYPAFVAATSSTSGEIVKEAKEAIRANLWNRVHVDSSDASIPLAQNLRNYRALLRLENGGGGGGGGHHYHFGDKN